MFITRQNAQNIVNEMKRSIHHDLNIMNSKGTIMASTNPSRIDQHHAGALQIIQESLPALIIWEDTPSRGVQQGINLPIVLNGKTVGVIGISGDPLEVSVFGDIIKRMTEIMVESTYRQEQADLIYKAKSLFLENWIFAPSLTHEALESASRMLDIDVYAPYTIALLDIRSHAVDNKSSENTSAEDSQEIRDSLILRTLQSHLRDNPQHFCTLIRNQFVVLLNKVTQQEAYQRARTICRDIGNYHHVTVSAGISTPTADPLDLQRCYLEAQTACQAAAQGQAGRVFLYDQISLELIVQSIPPALLSNMHKMLFSSCSPQEQEEFANTILLYFEEGGDIKRCAERLFIHRNTFQYRMDQLRKKTGYSLKDPREATLLYLTTAGNCSAKV